VTQSDITVIGAGPYGLSIAAHLKAQGADFRIFGRPMYTWRTNMPKGMHLKSEGFASSLSDPSGFTIEAYCKENNLPYHDTDLPVPLEVFSAYGMEFQRRLVGQLDTNMVESIERSSDGFRVQVQGGKFYSSRRVVVASGLTNYEFTPPILAALPDEVMTHSARHSDVVEFRGREVIVVGAGSSAIDLAAALHQAGAKVQVVARRAKIRFHDPPTGEKPSLIQRFRHPKTGIGSGWTAYFLANAPHIFQRMPLRYRLHKVRTVLGPAPGWFVKEQVVGKMPLLVGHNVVGAEARNGRVFLKVTDSDGNQKTIEADHVISATGYKVNIDRLPFLDTDIRNSIKTVERTPVLNSYFESSVRGLYFVGVSAANSFGPLLRFACGADFTARRVSHHLIRTAKVVPARVEDYAEKEVAVGP
jgi:cation diffusion facilitator CzcD-associated flavoprotein CzcO